MVSCKKNTNFAIANRERLQGPLAQLNRASDYGSEGCRFESCTNHKFGSLAQLNRASDYGSEGCRFESCRSHEGTSLEVPLNFVFLRFEKENYLRKRALYSSCLLESKPLWRRPLNLEYERYSFLMSRLPDSSLSRRRLFFIFCAPSRR